MRDTIAEFFGEGWTHARIDAELQSAKEAYERRASAGRKGGKAKSDGKQSSSNAKAGLKQSQPQSQSTEPNGSDAPPAVDARQLLWSEGLSILKAISGKPDSGARQLLGKWLKAGRDDCALVMSKIIAARDNRVGDPVAWITAAVSPPGTSKQRSGAVAALHHIIESENNGSEGIFGDHRHVELLPTTGIDGQRDTPENVLGSPSRREFAGHH
jgi:hypothetical protein